jgi:hypothetical protein
LFLGTLSIRSCTSTQARITVVSNPLSALKVVPINELDLGGDREIGNQAAMLAHALATTNQPLNYDYVFAPVLNPAFCSEFTGDPRCRFQNYYAGGAFQVAHAYPALMPFVRVEYLLSRIFAGLEYTFQNFFQITPELRRLLLYNNRSLWGKEGDGSSVNLAETINLQNHVSKTRSTDFLKKLMSVFCLGLFTNPWTQTIRLVPMRDVMTRPPRWDWSEYAVDGYTIEDDGADTPRYICYATQDDDGAFPWYRDRYRKPKPETVLGIVTDLFELEADPDYETGIYYIVSRHSYYFYQKGGVRKYFFKWTELGCAPTDEGRPSLELELAPIWDMWPYGEGYGDINVEPIPYCRIPGKVEYQNGVDDNDDPKIVEQTAEIPDRLLWYRGLAPLFDETGTYPCCSTNVYNGDAQVIEGNEFSLRIDGERGIYNRWWGLWHQCLLNGKPVTQAFQLPLAHLTEFGFEQKVRYLGMDYVVKKLRIERLLDNGKVLVQASMVSVF